MFGIATTAVKPPSAAARLPVSIVSASSLPGSRRWAWRSTNPGATTQPGGVEHVVAVAGCEVVADVGDDAVVDADVGAALAALVDDRAAA